MKLAVPRFTAIRIEGVVGSSYEDVIRDALALANKLDWPVAFDWQPKHGKDTWLVKPGENYYDALADFRRVQKLLG